MPRGTPLFPRYIFARFVLGPLFAKVTYTRGVQKIVGFGESCNSPRRAIFSRP